MVNLKQHKVLTFTDKWDTLSDSEKMSFLEKHNSLIDTVDSMDKKLIEVEDDNEYNNEILYKLEERVDKLEDEYDKRQ